jgi:CxxC-x17-CxxC domain-containing protein
VPFTDKTLTCADCGSPFTFTAGEQEFHQSKGFTNEPRRCPTCRAARRTDGGGGGGGGFSRGDREMFSATCGSCGKEAKVPFQPRGDRPVYCNECFQSQPRSSDRSAAPRYFSAGAAGGHNARLDGGTRDGRSDQGPASRTWAMQPFSSARSPRRREVRSDRSN